MLYKSMTAGLASIALVFTPTMAAAQPLPQQELVAEDEATSLRGNPAAIGVTVVLLALLLAIFNEEIFGDDDGLGGGDPDSPGRDRPVSP